LLDQVSSFPDQKFATFLEKRENPNERNFIFMRKNFSPLIWATTLVISSLGLAQTNTNVIRAEIEGGASRRETPRDPDSAPPREGSRFSYEKDHHHRPFEAETDNDWYERCFNASRELIRARRQGNFYATQGRLAKAHEIFSAAINRIADGDLSISRRAPGPHLVFAAEEAKQILDNTASATSALPERLKVQVEYLMSSELIELLLSAYDDLDTKYARGISSKCGDCWFDRLPREYFDGVRKLAQRFVDLQTRLDEVQASDLVELKISKSIAVAATHFLEVYTGRRAYCSAIENLIDLRDGICEYLEDPDYPSHEMIPWVRARLRKVRNELSESRRDCN
jgi:hypothetical protein